MKTLYVLLTLLIISASQAMADGRPNNPQAAIAYFNESDGDHSGVEISALLSSRSHYAFRFSGALFSDENNAKIKDVYGGFSATGYLHMNQRYFNPYVGVGLFMGETFNCSKYDEKEGLCEEDVVLAVYPELGVDIALGNLHLFPFVRRYFDTNHHAGTTSAFGIHIGYDIGPLR